MTTDAGIGRTVLIAPDSFKGTASADEVSTAIARGWRMARPEDVIVSFPMADGGEGTLAAFARSRAASIRRPVTVVGPDDRTARTQWLEYAADDGARCAVVELANTSGITMMRQLAPYAAHTFGFGQAIAAALEAGVDRILLGLGSSASTDGGMGALAALGARFVDARGEDVGLGNQALDRIEHADLSRLAPVPPGGALLLSDVDVELLGPHGAVAVFGAQKGMSPPDFAAAEARLSRYAEALRREIDVAVDLPGAGAAGGTGFALSAWGGEMTSGAAAVARESGLAHSIPPDAIVITGEGRYDLQSARGKVPSVVVELARARGARVALVAGSIETETTAFDAAVSLSALAGSSAAAMTEPDRWLTAAGRDLATASALVCPRLVRE